jgi:uncharacterized damage-inducible protein DinB
MRRTTSLRMVTSGRAVELSREFRTANDRVVEFCLALAAGGWTARCEPEGRTIGQVIEHIAAGHLIIGGIVEAIALDLPLPAAARRTEITGARYNARQAKGFERHSRKQGLRALRRNGARVERFLAALSDEQLVRSAVVEGRSVSVEQAILHGLLHHLDGHLTTIEAAAQAR